jgi:anti-sigma B factor antagonist
MVAIHGRVTVDNSGEMRAALRSALRKKPAELRVDLSGLAYTDTSGLATLVEAFRTANQQSTRLVLAVTHGQPLYLLEITRLDRLFGIAASRCNDESS